MPVDEWPPLENRVGYIPHKCNNASGMSSTLRTGRSSIDGGALFGVLLTLVAFSWIGRVGLVVLISFLVYSFGVVVGKLTVVGIGGGGIDSCVTKWSMSSLFDASTSSLLLERTLDVADNDGPPPRMIKRGTSFASDADNKHDESS